MTLSEIGSSKVSIRSRNDCIPLVFCFRWIIVQFKREFEMPVLPSSAPL